MKRHHGRCLAIQIAAGELRVAGFRFSAGAPELFASAVEALPQGAALDGELLEPETVARILRPLLERPAFRGVRRAAFCLCSSQIRSESVLVPPVGKRRLRQLLYANLDLYFPVRQEDYALVWAPEPAQGPELRLRVWAAPKPLLAGYLRLAADCGLRLAALDYGCNSLSQAAGTEPEGADSALLLYAGHEQLLLCFRQDGRALLQRVLPRRDDGGGTLDELGMLLDYCASLHTGAALSAVRCGGDTEEDCAVAETLALRCGLSPQPLRCGVETGWGLCLGAAQARLDFAPTLNGPGRWPALRRWLPPVLGGAALLAAVVLCLGARGTSDAALQALRAQTERAEALLLPLRAEAKAAQSAEAAEAAEQEAYSHLRADLETLTAALPLRSGALGAALEELTAALPEGCALSYLGAEAARLYVQVACSDKAEAAAVLTRLRDLERAELLAVSDLSQGPQAGAPRFSEEDAGAWSARFAEAQRSLAGDGRVFFTLQLELRAEEGAPS